MKATIKKVADNITAKDGRIVNLITLSNDTVIVRDTNQFNADLKGSRVRKRALNDLHGGTVEGDFKYHKAGQPYTTNEYIDKEGNTVEAREGIYERDGYRVEGFLTLIISAKADQADRNAMANAELMAEILGYDVEETPEPIVKKTVVEPETIPTV